MACGLMILLGAAMLTWYYTNTLTRHSRAQQTAKATVLRRAQGEMPLPAIDGFSSLKAAFSERRPDLVDARTNIQVAAADPLPIPLMPSQSSWGTPGASHSAPGGVRRKSTKEATLERLLAGAAFARETGGRIARAGLMRADLSDIGAAELRLTGAAPSPLVGPTGTQPADPTSTDGDIGPFLRPTTIASARALVLPTRRFLLPKGAFIDCTLETAIDSTLPGMTTCITATDTFGSDGSVVLLERGTKLIGETRGQVHHGTARVFVLWTEARTPVGVVVPLDSPGTDELGRSGLTGEVNRHFWERFGAAILISTLDGAVQAAVQSAGRGGGPVIYNPSNSESVVTDVLKNSVNIPPTITKSNGDRIQVFVARDVDFRSVYELRPVTTAH